jgi:hypothetical protein
MAKKKESIQEIKDCSKCINKVLEEKTIYCKLRLFDENILKDSAIVKFAIDCKYFK